MTSQDKKAAKVPPEDTLNTKDLRRVLGSSLLGSIIEYYDFILYATAASIVFDKVFFANLDPAVALFASFGTLAAGYVARPLGGLVFGHFGDRLGRKQMLVISMMMMGFATIAIGLLPTPEVIGWLSPVLLVLLRMVQGLSVGGEWGGATLMAMEHAPPSRRGMAAAFANAGGPAGGLLATFTVSITSALTGDAFLEWGWRIPFLLSAALIVIGMIVRLKVTESPVFQELVEQGEKKQAEIRVPIVEVVQKHSRLVIMTLVAALGFYACQGILTTWGVAQAVNNGISREWVLNWKGVAAVITIVLSFLVAKWSDRIGRRTVLTIASISGVILAWPVVALLSSGSPWLFVLGILVGTGLIQGLFAGPIGAFVSELFPPKVRYTGASMSYQLASTIGAGFTPMIAAALMLAGGFNAVALFWIAVLATALICIRLVPEGAEALKDTQSARSEYKTAKRIATRPRRDLTSTSSSASEE